MADRLAERSARRDYEYDARKRLYLEYEPLRFHLLEAATSAREFIRNLAALDMTRGIMDDGSRPRGDYFRTACVYTLTMPAAYFKAIQQRLTLVDLAIDRAAHIQYVLGKEIIQIFARDGEIAENCNLKYTPYVYNWRELRINNPAQYRRQGFAPGRLDNFLLSVLTNNAGPVVVAFGEFEAMLSQRSATDFKSAIGAAADLFEEFTPQSRPVLWRILVCQYILYGLLISCIRNTTTSKNDLEALIDGIDTDVISIQNLDIEVLDVVKFMKNHLLSLINSQIEK